MFEPLGEPVVSRRRFAVRLVTSTSLAGVVIGVSLLVGMCGYHLFEGLAWTDAFAEAAMILSGMGPLSELRTTSGKLFAGFYALYSGLILVAASSIVVVPIVHRVLHKFHADPDLDETKIDSDKGK